MLLIMNRMQNTIPLKLTVQIFTDGACRGNPGIGGWGAVLQYQHHQKMLSGAEAYTTNNQMELTAAIQALSALRHPCKVNVTTDSTYVKKGITEWLPHWKSNGWKTSQKAHVKNRELWEQLDHAMAPHEIEWHWVKGHAGHPENELADRLANLAIDRLLIKQQKEFTHE